MFGLGNSSNLKQLALGIFKNKDCISYAEMVTEVMPAVNVQERTAKDYVKYMRDNNIIEKTEGSNYQIKLFERPSA
jgi:predicted transcriptional regulator